MKEPGITLVDKRRFKSWRSTPNEHLKTSCFEMLVSVHGLKNETYSCVVRLFRLMD